MREARELIRELGKMGKTVFVSSHLLGEVEQMCDHVGIVKEGRLLTHGAVSALLRRGEALERRGAPPPRGGVSPVTSMLAAELLKVRKRWMPYVLLLVMAAGAAVQIWLLGYVSWRESEVEFQQSALRAFALPWSLSALLDAGQFWGAILVGILTASPVATEHGWGTVRPALIRGQTRNQYLAIKLLGSALIAAVSLLLAFGIGVCLSVMATAVADRPT